MQHLYEEAVINARMLTWWGMNRPTTELIHDTTPTFNKTH
jgi:hypothetical protein